MFLLREPIVQLLLVGGLLFGVHRVVAPPPPGRVIDVTAELKRGLVADHRRRTGAAPTAEEERALVQRWVENEALYREAVALGLDRGDVIVRRRLLQKMDLLAQDLGTVEDPDEATLARFVESQGARYAEPARLTIEQLFLDGGRRGEKDAAALRTELEHGADPARLGDPFPHGRILAGRSPHQLDALFGPGFGDRVSALPDGNWSLPLRSSYGWHLVRVTARVPATPPTVDAARDRALRDWREAERARRDRAARAAVVARYQVREGS